MLISDEYRQLNTELHQNPKYGSRVRTRVYAEIKDLMAETKADSLLDYGCGKGTMADHLDNVTLYDPCMPEFSVKPQGQFDVVACCDVLEHVEPDCIQDVLNDIFGYARKAVYLVISTRPAGKTLADGRNAHLIVKSRDWWAELLAQNFPFWQLTVKTSDISEITVIGVNNGRR
jgi:2-polyprenyl-3-methyl-5-hydroxy-6-metoxy-1,4-benzoquinol methylase